MRKIAMALVLTGGMLGFGAAAAQAGTGSATLYVSPSGTHGAADSSCRTAAYSSISAAVAAAKSGGTVVVCRGTYHAQVVVSKPLNLVGKPGAIINAKGQPPLTVGPMKLPGSVGIGVLATSNVRVSGFQVVNAGFDAILVARSSHVSVSHNVLLHNGDVGVDINGSSWSSATGNTAKYNTGGGFLVADDVGPNGHNVVSWNVASNNPGGCGVILAGHTTAGVSNNLVANNTLTYNGTLKSSGGGAGVVIATEVPGETVANNTVTGNTIYGNGLAGVTIHAHLPGQNLNGNRITGNWIGTNNTLGDPIDLTTSPTSKTNVATADTKTTGILVGSASKIRVQINRNYISNNHYGIFLEGVGKVVHASLQGNRFHNVAVPVKSVVVS
ncbi:MAG TPA: right-handed parallel beta-helix repeat-containing protein [Trebonia sp.]